MNFVSQTLGCLLVPSFFDNPSPQGIDRLVSLLPHSPFPSAFQIKRNDCSSGFPKYVGYPEFPISSGWFKFDTPALYRHCKFEILPMCFSPFPRRSLAIRFPFQKRNIIRSDPRLHLARYPEVIPIIHSRYSLFPILRSHGRASFQTHMHTSSWPFCPFLSVPQIRKIFFFFEKCPARVNGAFSTSTKLEFGFPLWICVVLMPSRD